MAGPQTSTPIYGCLISFGDYEFPLNTSYLSSLNRNIPRPLSYNLGQTMGVDTNANAPVAFKSQENTWVILIIADDQTLTQAECSAYVEGQWQQLDYYLSVPNPTTGLSQQTQTLVCQLRAGGTVSCQAALVDLSLREADRSYSMLTLNAVFQYLTPWL